MRTPQEFNLKFNQNSTSHGSKEDHFSYFSNVEEEEATELGDYFSDDEEDDNWDEEDLSNESDPLEPYRLLRPRKFSKSTTYTIRF
jgi:hypothetical protein